MKFKFFLILLISIFSLHSSDTVSWQKCKDDDQQNEFGSVNEQGLQRKLRYNAHVLQRMKERLVTQEQIRQVIKKGTQSINKDRITFTAQDKKGYTTTVVISRNPKSNIDRVITVIRCDKTKHKLPVTPIVSNPEEEQSDEEEAISSSSFKPSCVIL
ncbi:MAG: DUF4258 domain-containing protein [Candidatus Babeliales bacterium]|nr:DUF4258 domain-containing protein [Candidatus Babeliales bacterium]